MRISAFEMKSKEKLMEKKLNVIENQKKKEQLMMKNNKEV